MALLNIEFGSTSQGDGDTLKQAFTKVNQNSLALSNVNNTTDLLKPISTATQTALNLKANLASPTFTGTPSLPTGTIGVTQIAGNSSTLLATTAFVTTAGNLKANLDSPAFIGVVTFANDIYVNDITVGKGNNDIATNTVIGFQSLSSNTTGNNNTVIGYGALSSNTTGYNQVAIGQNALRDNTTGNQNIAIGRNSLLVNILGINNIGNGTSALYSNTTGSGNMAFGVASLLNNISGSYNIGAGTEAGAFTSTGSAATILNNSIMLGHSSSPLADNETNQIVIGHGSNGLGSNTTVLGNASTVQTWLGGRVTIGTTIDNDVNLLQVAGDILVNGINIGKGDGNISSNTVFGLNSGNANTSGYNGTYFGTNAGQSNTIGNSNLFFGYNAGASNTDGNNNVFIGSLAGDSNTIGANNTFVGQSCGTNNNGDRNTFFSQIAGLSNTTGYDNLFLGRASGRFNTEGYSNVLLGGNSGGGITNGFCNTFVGFLTGLGNASGNTSNCSTLGFDAYVSGENQVQLGNSFTTTHVWGTVQNRSDLRDKADVRDTILGLDFICKLRPVDFKWDIRENYKAETPLQGELSDDDFKIKVDLWVKDNKIGNLQHDGTHKRSRFHHGLIAQEVKDLGFGGFQDHSINGGEDILSIGYDELIAPMIKAIQELKAEIELLKAK